MKQSGSCLTKVQRLAVFLSACSLTLLEVHGEDWHVKMISCGLNIYSKL